MAIENLKKANDFSTFAFQFSFLAIKASEQKVPVNRPSVVT
jgi:hypothetical protein